MNWIKNASAAAKVYPNGFNFDSSAIGSLYNPALTPPLNFNPGLLILSGANLGGSITNVLTVNGTSAAGATASLVLSAAKGTFKGSFVIPPSKTKIPFTGVFLQNVNTASGYFVSGGLSGKVFFGPAN